MFFILMNNCRKKRGKKKRTSFLLRTCRGRPLRIKHIIAIHAMECNNVCDLEKRWNREERVRSAQVAERRNGRDESSTDFH